MKIATVIFILIVALVGLGFLLNDSLNTHIALQNTAEANANLVTERENWINRVEQIKVELEALKKANQQLAIENQSLRQANEQLTVQLENQSAASDKNVANTSPEISSNQDINPAAEIPVTGKPSEQSMTLLGLVFASLLLFGTGQVAYKLNKHQYSQVPAQGHRVHVIYSETSSINNHQRGKSS
jgi:regulator of replication initiation timing